MQRINEFQLYELAIAVHPLTLIQESAKYSEVWLDWRTAGIALQNIFKQRALEFCFQAANELYAAIEVVVPSDLDKAIEKYQALPKPEEPLGWGPIYPIREAAQKFETVLSAELSNSDTYWISPKGTHKTSMLLQYAHLELPSLILTEVPEASADFDEAGKCLLFDTPTAVGFHLLRATEAVIRKYYAIVTGVEPKKKFRNWGAYLKKLNQCGANSKITGYLDHIRENYRNPILHPEVTLTADDAQVLFGVCVSAIVLMATELKTLTAKGGTLQFPTGLASAGPP